MHLSQEYRPSASFTPWGPFIPATYYVEPITHLDVLLGSMVFGLNLFFALLASYRVIGQIRTARSPRTSAFFWMVWIEIIACIIISAECLLYLLKLLRPSFYFYTSLLVLWGIQVQLLLQIIINRIQVILLDRKKGKILCIGVAVIVTLITISVFCIWIPARLQISPVYAKINAIWDRIEKVVYLLIDAALNWYFIHVVRANLITNGLRKYEKLVRFNQQIIIISLLMDVMIIAAMSIPNGFVYCIFHPLAYLVKLNIEMSMAGLIKKLAVSSFRPTNNMSYMWEFALGSADSDGTTASSRAILCFGKAKTREKGAGGDGIQDVGQGGDVVQSVSRALVEDVGEKRMTTADLDRIYTLDGLGVLPGVGLSSIPESPEEEITSGRVQHFDQV